MVNISFSFYMLFVSMVLILMGVMLFFYSLFFNINPLLCQPTSSCVFYLVLGLICLCIWVGGKVVDKNKRSCG